MMNMLKKEPACIQYRDTFAGAGFQTGCIIHPISTVCQVFYFYSLMYANMDPRQRETLFRIVYETCRQKGFQYICSINEDALESFESLMDAGEYKNIIKDNIVLELNDDAPESKLLGIQIDMDLEDKIKASEDMN